jgi:protein required for attachment to host cells
MNDGELQKRIQQLAFLEESDETIISFYINPETKYREILNDQVRSISKSIEHKVMPVFWEALGRIEVFLGTGIRAGSQGVAVFARGGERPFFLPMQFGAPLPNQVTVGSRPRIYPLVELRDNYYRYVVLLSSEESASIFKLSAGTITETVRIVRPELRRHAGREWTKEHYQSHSQARLQQFINEQIRSLDQAISSGDYRHLVLAGDPRTTSQVEKALPKALSNMVVGAVRASEKDKTSELISATLTAFEEHEETESLSVASHLGQEIGKRGAAVKGTSACLRALKNFQARTLVLSQAYEPGMGCRFCGELLIENLSQKPCPRCDRRIFRAVDIKEEMVRLAEQKGCAIEIVKNSDAMTAFDGVGCLLRYLTTERYHKPAA